MGVVGCSVRAVVRGKVLSYSDSLVFDPDIKTKLLHFISSISWCFYFLFYLSGGVGSDDMQFCLRIGESISCV